jgi:drug/metabolite transporter (DMT)-like permease
MSAEVWSPLLIAILASMTQAFGISLQRKSHLSNQDKSQLRQPLWITGFLIYTISNVIGSTCTIGYLPIVILAPVGAIGLVFNAIFAKVVLNEPFTSRTILGKEK